MDIGIFAWFGYTLPMEERVTLIREAGYRSVMLWWGDEHRDVDGPKELQPALFRAHGLRIANVHAPFGEASQLWTDTLRGQAMEDTLVACLRDCSAFDIPVAVVHLTEGQNPPPPNAIGLARMRRLAEKAESLCVDIALENLRYPQYLDYVYERIPCARLKLCYDSGHENCRSPQLDLLAKHGHRLAALHLHDNDGTDDQHILPFDGTTPWDRIAAHLRRLRYPGDLTLEIDSFHGAYPAYTAEAYLAEGMRRAQRLQHMIEG